MKIFFFHHAGGDQYAYRNFKTLVNEMGWEAIYYDHPGHGERFGEPLLSDMKDIAAETYEALKGELSEDYAFFGVSMGTLTAYLICHQLIEDGKPLPKHFFAASRRCPASHRRYPKSTHLESDEFWQVISEYGGCPPALLEQVELREVFEPIIRADFKALEEYNHIDRNPLNIPATILYGKEDRFKVGDMDSWQNHFCTPVDIKIFEGGHFFCYTQAENMVNVLKEKL